MAGFVGTSNLLTGDVARTVLGRDGRSPSGPRRSAWPSRTARSGRRDERERHVRDVIYLGSDTRYLVALDAGGQLVVTAQNLTTSSMEALAAQGRPSA